MRYGSGLDKELEMIDLFVAENKRGNVMSKWTRIFL